MAARAYGRITGSGHNPRFLIAIYVQASIPKGFVALKYAHVSLEGPMLSDDEFVFRITTPLRSLCLRAKVRAAAM